MRHPFLLRASSGSSWLGARGRRWRKLTSRRANVHTACSMHAACHHARCSTVAQSERARRRITDRQTAWHAAYHRSADLNTPVGQVVNDKLASSVRFHQLEMMSKIYDRLTQKCLTVGHSNRRPATCNRRLTTYKTSIDDMQHATITTRATCNIQHTPMTRNMRRSLGAAEDRKRELRWALHAQLQRMTGRPHRSLPSTRSVRYTVRVIDNPHMRTSTRYYVGRVQSRASSASAKSWKSYACKRPQKRIRRFICCFDVSTRYVMVVT